RDRTILGGICGLLDVTPQKQAERKALEQKNLLEAFFRAMSDGVFVKDRAGRFLLVNEAGANILGKTVDEVIGKTDADLLPESVARSCRERDEHVLRTSQPIISEEPVALADGPHLLRLSKAPLRDPGGETVGVVGIAHDVTDLLRMREELRQGNERFRLAMQATNEELYDWDPRTDRVIRSGAVGGSRGPGDSRDPTVLDRARDRWLDGVHPDDRSRVQKSFEEALRSAAGTWTSEYRVVHPDGSTSWMLDRAVIVRDAQGKPERVVGSSLDVTPQKRSEEKLSRLNRDLEARIAERTRVLQATQDRLSLALEGAELGTWDLDFHTCRVDWSDTMVRLLGYPPGTVAPSFEGWHSRVHPEDRDRILAELDRVRREGGAYFVEYRIRRADTGEIRWMTSRGRATPDDQGRIAHLAGISFDDTDRKRAQNTLREALEESNDFARNVAHELQSPLRSMSMCAQLLQEECSRKVLDEAGQSLFERLIGAARRLDGLTQDLLAYSRWAQNELPLGPVDVGSVIADVLGTMAEDLTQRHAVVQLQGPFAEVRGNAKVLYITVCNLMYNAIKFVAPGTAPRVLLRCEGQGAWVRLWVEDNGIGIRSQDQGRLFKVFERLAPEYPGTGIGLAMVRKGVERMGGQAGVESRVGEGSRFWIDLPRPGEPRSKDAVA
ncbi:MAG TPA: PAS domain-containing protein, partial [Planctomycetota bacterium]|nr:PAS domain-containing protein [Planctomycetota bacterium]